MRGKNLVAGIYYHPEAYPPTLNAIEELSKYYNRISIVHRPHLKGSWKFPSNVTVIASGKYMTARQQETSGTVQKILFFARFVIDLLKECIQNKPETILMYDVHALFAYRLIRPLLFFKHRFWYHNHDVTEPQRKYSIGWFAARSEMSAFSQMEIFTLPTADRLSNFPIDRLKGKYFVIPNYPSVKFYQPFYQPHKPMDEIRLIFQGRIADGHGLEEIVPLLTETIEGKKLRLVLKGHCPPDYQDALLQLAASHQVTDRITFYGFTPYEEVPKIAAGCHIGIAIFSKTEIMHVTLGTASNKIYEYVAVGLPVIYTDKEYFRKYLSKYPWAFGVQDTTASIRQQIVAIMNDYERYAHSAHSSFLNGLNFEEHFRPVTAFLKTPEHAVTG
jgi:glycosyltransferase involved in cell wall biosynthesis